MALPGRMALLTRWDPFPERLPRKDRRISIPSPSETREFSRVVSFLSPIAVDVVAASLW